ncbi:hypothetical protein [Mesobacillus campisalis]|uniref:hypothetical protein n=1 Tax=Mesobacillus campisalis TaxID=1408103 RepID=UPI0012E32241|nr:hypothetical protein [Mesobacillus campisalis]
MSNQVFILDHPGNDVDYVKNWLRKRKQKKMQDGSQDEEGMSGGNAEGKAETKKEKRARGLFDKYGLPGLTIIGSFLSGPMSSRLWG